MNPKITAFAKTATTELIFNKWSLMFLLYAIPALIIGQEAVKTVRAVNWTPAELNVTSSQFERQKDFSKGVRPGRGRKSRIELERG